MKLHRRFALGAAFMTLAACACAPKYVPEPGGQIPVDAAVRISEDGAGKYTFRYSAPSFGDDNGNFDFTSVGGQAVLLTFRIEGGSIAGIRFKQSGRDAMWIVADEGRVNKGSPQGPYDGRQFSDFSVSPDGQTLTVLDRNDDGITYRYALRFDLNGQTVQHDPDVKNGEGGGH